MTTTYYSCYNMTFTIYTVLLLLFTITLSLHLHSLKKNTLSSCEQTNNYILECKIKCIKSSEKIFLSIMYDY